MQMTPKELKTIIDSFIAEDDYQDIIHSAVYYFSELSNLFTKYKEYDITSFKKVLEDFIAIEQEDFRFQDLLNKHDKTKSYDFLLLIGKLIASFDEKGYNKNVWNPYPDKRVISRAQFTQKNWTYCFFKYKLNNFTFSGLDDIKYSTFRYAVDYILNPEKNVNITSQNHRKEIVNYFALKDEKEIINLFENYTASVKV